tara:strand:- start:688 stop:855 length:168 start_codon:yes stop_codon:yes gene_type:complete
MEGKREVEGKRVLGGGGKEEGFFREIIRVLWEIIRINFLGDYEEGDYKDKFFRRL